MTADDKFAVRNVIARLALYADGPDVDAYSDLFTPDASWEMPGAPRKGHGLHRGKGQGDCRICNGV
jgi:hypothetical protein